MEFKAAESFSFNYGSYSIVKSEEDEDSISTPIDISVHGKNAITGIKVIKENETSKHTKNYKCKLNDITTDSSINKIEFKEESCNSKFSKFCPSTVKRKHKSKIHVHLTKSKQSCSNKTKDETNHRIVKNVFKKNSCGNGYMDDAIQRINIKNTPIGDITKPVKIKNVRRQTKYTLSLPKIILRPKTYAIHKCNYSCVEWTDYDQSKTKKINMLAIPLYFGFKRHTTNGYDVKKSITYYETPCGVSIQNINEMLHYLVTTKSKMTIDQFDFNSSVNPLAKYHILKPIKFLDDLSEGLEFRPITCVNSINDELPPKIKYTITRQATAGVNINVDTDFLCGCDCTDNCQDKSKCACWQSTINGQDNMPDFEKDPNAGYIYRRLYENVPTGIYECNQTCKCNSLCLNRVVQQNN